MKEIHILKEEIHNGEYDNRILEVCMDKKQLEYQRNRYALALRKFADIFGEKMVEIYSAPGRTEVCGNHTDHQHGHVLAASVNQDAIAVAALTEDGKIRLVSGNSKMIEIDTKQLQKKEEEMGTTAALIRGAVSGLAERGYRIGGFEAYVTSDVRMGAGMSSSAAFESLIGCVLSGLYNDMEISAVDIAKAGQYAENVYFGKPCGLMDQMACSVGGLIYIDFADKENPMIEKVPCDLEKEGYSLCISDTLGSHADLTDDYAAIPAEMKQIAEFFGKNFLREVSETEFYANFAKLRESVSDRAVLRAMHFFGEQQRVGQGVQALRRNDFPAFLDVIQRSGDSSSKLLQNIYSEKDTRVQNVTIALAVSEHILQTECRDMKKNAYRVHGGGFAGTIQAFVKNEKTAEYKRFMEEVFGENTCHILQIRRCGGIRLL